MVLIELPCSSFRCTLSLYWQCVYVHSVTAAQSELNEERLWYTHTHFHPPTGPPVQTAANHHMMCDPPFSTRPSDCNQIWHTYSDRFGTDSNLNKFVPRMGSLGPIPEIGLSWREQGIWLIFYYIKLQYPFVCLYVPPLFFDTTVWLQPNLARMQIDLGIIGTNLFFTHPTQGGSQVGF